MFASAVYRRCADELGAIPGIDLTMLTVDSWRMNGLPMPFEPILPESTASIRSSYATVVGKAGWRGYENRGFYRSGLFRAFQISRPEVLFLMEEPFSVFAAEILFVKSLVAPRIPVVFFTWNNLSLDIFDYRPGFFYRNVARQTLPRMHYGLTANSDAIDVLRKSGFDKPVKAIGYGVDTAEYVKKRTENVNAIRGNLRIGKDDKLIGYVGRMIDMKGVDLLINAFARIKRETPDLSAKLLLLGSGEDEKKFLRIASDLGVSSDVRHVPSVPQRDIPDYMNSLDILVLPSRRKAMWAEQFGRVLVEAMAAGKIVIGSSSGAIPEVIGNAGFVFPENDSAALTGELRRALFLSDEERKNLAEAARARADYFNWPRFARDAFGAIEYCHSLYNHPADKTAETSVK
jgi:glycosyltransferase involved in cell wall biosynthesis